MINSKFVSLFVSLTLFAAVTSKAAPTVVELTPGTAPLTIQAGDTVTVSCKGGSRQFAVRCSWRITQVAGRSQIHLKIGNNEWSSYENLQDMTKDLRELQETGICL